MSFQACKTLLRNTKEGISKNVSEELFLSILMQMKEQLIEI